MVNDKKKNKKSNENISSNNIQSGNNRLGKGLSALMGETSFIRTQQPKVKNQQVEKNSKEKNTLPLDKITPNRNQPRRNFDEKLLFDLAASIKKQGILQPILVRTPSNNNGKHEIIAGERRWRASKIAGLKEIPVVFKQVSDDNLFEIALIENIQREDLSPLEEANGYQELISKYSNTQEKIAATVGKSRSYIANMLRLLQLPAKIQKLLNNKKLSVGHARALIGNKDAEKLAIKIIDEGLSVRQTEALVKGTLTKNNQKWQKEKEQQKLLNKEIAEYRAKPKNRNKNMSISTIEESIEDVLGLRTRIYDKNGEGQLVIQYDSINELDELITTLTDKKLNFKKY